MGWSAPVASCSIRSEIAARGNAHRIDCTTIGQTCEVGFNRPNCVDTSTECTHGYDTTCDGAGLTTCSLGKVVTLACSSIGLTSCDSSNLACK